MGYDALLLAAVSLCAADMSLTIPLAVRVKTATADKHITRDLRDLAFRSAAPGGFASATFALNRPLATQPDEINYYGTVYIYDTRNGRTVWEGRLEDPGRTASDGEVWSVTAVGPSAQAQDRTVPLIYIDQSMSDGWRRFDNATPGATLGVSDDPGTTNTPAIVAQFPNGQPLVTDSRAVWVYDRIYDAGQKLARVDYTWDAGRTSGSLAVEAIARTDYSAGDVARTQTFNTAGGGSSAKVVVTDWSNARNTLELRIRWTGGATAVADDVTWASMRNIFILAMRYAKGGTELTSGYSTNSVLASDVVADLLGRLLTGFDGANASVATTSYAITSLTYPDGVTPAQVLDDLMLLEPAYYWAAWESTSAGNRFEWKAWPTTVRYEADVMDGFDSPGSAANLFNTVRVTYVNPNGQVKTIQRTQTVQALTDAGLTREGFLDLRSTGISNVTNANRAGDQWLAQRATPPNAGTLQIARPILDRTDGKMAMPWEILPGELIRVRGVKPSIDSLNATDRDGVTVFRIVAVDFRAADAAATLELDSYPLTTSRALATLAKRRSFR
jgi:hypothetical protein